ncbi:dihydroneopterin aldolase [Acinetobacter sp. MD2]|nr:dihydroneopterin aldolase [Acinetobacter sp. MD2]
MPDAILIEGLKVETVVGCFAWERKILQPLLLDLVVEHRLQAAALSDELVDTVNYAQICELCAEVIQTAQPKLIEHAAHLVLEKLFQTFDGISRIRLTIRKPAIIAEAHSVGIRLERQRHDFCSRTGE